MYFYEGCRSQVRSRTPRRPSSSSRQTSIRPPNRPPQMRTCAPVNASMVALRLATHDSGSGWVATPFLCDAFIHDSTPVYPGAHHGLLAVRHLKHGGGAAEQPLLDRRRGRGRWRRFGRRTAIVDLRRIDGRGLEVEEDDFVFARFIHDPHVSVYQPTGLGPEVTSLKKLLHGRDGEEAELANGPRLMQVFVLAEARHP